MRSGEKRREERNRREAERREEKRRKERRTKNRRPPIMPRETLLFFLLFLFSFSILFYPFYPIFSLSFFPLLLRPPVFVPLSSSPCLRHPVFVPLSSSHCLRPTVFVPLSSSHCLRPPPSSFILHPSSFILPSSSFFLLPSFRPSSHPWFPRPRRFSHPVQPGGGLGTRHFGSFERP